LARSADFPQLRRMLLLAAVALIGLVLADLHEINRGRSS
jgi:hypothetical protein